MARFLSQLVLLLAVVFAFAAQYAPASDIPGSVYSFGRNDAGRTGLGTTSGNAVVATPIKTDNLAGKTITQVAAGGGYSLLLADDGSVFSFGWNGHGRTGLGFGSDSVTTIATPINTDNLTGKTITQVAAGTVHSLLLADAAPGLPGDYNGNGTVEQADLDLVLLNWNESVADLPAEWVNERPTSGIVDQGELDGVLLNWGATAAQIATTAGVPEPSTLMLAMLLVTVLAVAPRRVLTSHDNPWTGVRGRPRWCQSGLAQSRLATNNRPLTKKYRPVRA